MVATLVLVLLAGTYIIGVYSECRLNAYSRGDARLYGFMGPLPGFKRYKTRNRMDCDRQCTTRYSCRSYTFDADTNQCHLFNAELKSSSGLTPTANAVYYYKYETPNAEFVCPPRDDQYHPVNFDGSCIQVRAVHIYRNHYDAAADCATTGGRLLVVNNAAKKTLFRNLYLCPGFSYNYIVDGNNTYASDYFATDAYTTSYGEVIEINSLLWSQYSGGYYSYYPDTRHCLYFHYTHHHTLSCTSTKYYMCEKPMDE